MSFKDSESSDNKFLIQEKVVKMVGLNVFKMANIRSLLNINKM